MSSPEICEADAQAAPDAQPATPDANPGIELLQQVEYPLNPDKPNFQPQIALRDGKVTLSITTTDSAQTPEFIAAKAKLEGMGCSVGIDRESHEYFVKITIQAPTTLFSPATIDALTARETAERQRAATSLKTRAAKSFVPGQHCDTGC